MSKTNRGNDVVEIVSRALTTIPKFQPGRIDRKSVEELSEEYRIECSELDPSAGVIRRRYTEYRG
jgi:hypothetical protein